MKIRDMFQKDINRQINGVIKVAQDEEEDLCQELSEYVITKELRKHFRTFYDNYGATLDQPSEQIGVWISGFFGSGKSHFLKMLSYLLSNPLVSGKQALDYFEDKWEDAALAADVVRCAGPETETLLFNIDTEAPQKKEATAILQTFAKVFHKHLGYDGDDIHVVRFEQFLDADGKLQAFHAAFERIHGKSWIEARSTFMFLEEEIVQAVTEVTGKSEQVIRKWFNTEDTRDYSIGSFVEEVARYVEKKGKNFRLLFMVDEIGQYIGDNGSLMLNLQTITENLGIRCRGQVWVMVTSQEAIDSVVKIKEQDFSKIQGRFNTRLSLSSTSVDEVICRRILAKNNAADQTLKVLYETKQSVLKNLFTFREAKGDLKGFFSAERFVTCYPFPEYQFLLLPKIFLEIRKHGNSGKHLSGGERSLLSGFQEAAQKVQERQEDALVPFHLFYDSVQTFLESAIRRVVERSAKAAENGEGLMPEDIPVLKLLYLIRYLDTDIRADLDNISILMIDSVEADKIALRKRISGSIDRLLKQNYISKSGDTYAFLTDEEQEMAKDIRDNTSVEPAKITAKISEIVYGDIFPLTKYRFGQSDLPFDRYVDETRHGSGGAPISLCVVTEGGNLADHSPEALIMESNNRALVVLPREAAYYRELEEALKIEQYSQKRRGKFTENEQRYFSCWNARKKDLENNARTRLEEAVKEARVFVCGSLFEAVGASAKDKFNCVLDKLCSDIYAKNDWVDEHAESPADLRRILNSGDRSEGTLAGFGSNDALREVSGWLERCGSMEEGVSMGRIRNYFGDVPYGWREMDIAALVARLAARRLVTLSYGGKVLEPTEEHVPDYLSKKTEVDRLLVKRRVAVSEQALRQARLFLKEFLNLSAIPEQEDALCTFIIERFDALVQLVRARLTRDYAAEPRLPGRKLAEDADMLYSGILKHRKDNVALVKALNAAEDELLAVAEASEPLDSFFGTQRSVFEQSLRLTDQLKQDRVYLESVEKTQELIRSIAGILEMPEPYRSIQQLPELNDKLKKAYDLLLEAKREELRKDVSVCKEQLREAAQDAPSAAEKLREAESALDSVDIAGMDSLTALDALKTRLSGQTDAFCRQLSQLASPPTEVQEVSESYMPPVTLARRELCSARTLRSKNDADALVETIRKKLYEQLDQNAMVIIE